MIPIILAVWVQSKFEPLVKKVIPQFLQMIFVPMIVLLVMVPLTFLLLGPIGTVIGNGLGSLFNSIYSFSPLVAGLIMGSLLASVRNLWDALGLCTDHVLEY